MKLFGSKKIIIFFIVNIIVLGFSFYTNHRWEDWYITYKASKNLGTGNGLVFHVGERLHTFTSPIGVLIPAFLSFISKGSSDEFVIWSFRVISSLFLSLSSLVLFEFLRKFSTKLFLPLAGTLFFATHILIVDFSINGMETAFMMFFLILFLYYLFSETTNKVLKLSFVVAALMYTRPDSIIYFGSIILGLFLFNHKFTVEIKDRASFISFFFKIFVVSIIIYLPWLVFTYFYYGSPIPHTIIAKGNIQDYSFRGLFRSFITFPYELIFKNSTPANSIFLPPYSYFGGWELAGVFSKVIVLITIFYFVLLKGSPIIRALSFAIYLLVFYLFRISGQGPMPWYLPNVAILIIVTFFLILSTFNKNKSIVSIIVLFFLAINMAVFVLGAQTIKAQQEIVEFGNRKEIGKWLKINSESGDTVFLECLGYIGYYSGLKTLDFPGMSSMEMVNARKRIKSNKYALLIEDLKPNWVVLRPWELDQIKKDLPNLLTTKYELKREFDVTNKVPDVIGREYLLYDSKFLVFKRKAN